MNVVFRSLPLDLTLGHSGGGFVHNWICLYVCAWEVDSTALQSSSRSWTGLLAYSSYTLNAGLK